MKISLRQVLGLGAFMVALLLLLWLFWPSSAPTVASRPSPPPPVPGQAPAIASIAGGDGDEVPPRMQAEDDILERLGIDKKVNPYCATINVWNARGVSLMTITQNMKDSQMMFNETELACLTASPVPPGVLDVADSHVLKPQPPGLTNGPMPIRLDDPDMVVPRVPGARGPGDGPKPH